MGRIAIEVNEQLNLLEQRGMVIKDREKAKEVLLDIGYYRLGFYWFPFEVTYPYKRNRTHEFVPGTKFEDIVHLYYFDFQLRSILTEYLNRIEIHFRTQLVYLVSVKHKKSPTWFANNSIVERDFVSSFDDMVYNGIKQNPIITQHHRKHINDRYAPAWKTIEFMTLGAIIRLYSSIKSANLKKEIALHFGLNSVTVFESYLNVILTLRNRIAHGNTLYDLNLARGFRRGPLDIEHKDLHNLNGAISLVYYMLGFISKNRVIDLQDKLQDLVSKHKKVDSKVYEIIKRIGVKL